MKYYTEEETMALFNAIYSGSVSASQLPPGLYLAILSELADALELGTGYGIFEAMDDLPIERRMIDALSDDLHMFSAAKTKQEIKALGEVARFTPEGQIRPYGDWAKEARPIFDEYNETWLETEHNQTIRESQSAMNWVDIERDKDLFPLLKFVTVGDAKVRKEHEDHDGIVRPVDDPFWDTHYPPLDWRCRCTVEKLMEDEEPLTDLKEKAVEPPPPEHAFNAGKERRCFSEEHPYYQFTEREAVGLEDNFGLPTLSPTNRRTGDE